MPAERAEVAAVLALLAAASGCQCRSAAPPALQVAASPPPVVAPLPPTRVEPLSEEASLARQLDAAKAPGPAEAARHFAQRGVGSLESTGALPWDCTRFGDDAAVCVTERELGSLGDAVPGVEGGNGRGRFSHVRLIRRVDGQLVGADWPAPSAALFSRVEHGEDCMTQCDEGGSPVEGAQPDEPAGVGTGACYADCHRAFAEQLAGTTTVETKLEFVGVLGVDRYVFRRVVTRLLNTNPYAEQPEGEEAPPPEEEEAPAEPQDALTTDYLLLEHRGSRGLTAADETVFADLEHPGSAVWKFGDRLFVSLDDGGVLEGDEACASEAAVQVSVCDGGVE